MRCWLKLTRTNNLFSAYTSADGSSWTEIGNLAMTMDNDFYIGLAVSANDNSTTGTATFDNVMVTGM